MPSCNKNPWTTTVGQFFFQSDPEGPRTRVSKCLNLRCKVEPMWTLFKPLNPKRNLYWDQISKIRISSAVSVGFSEFYFKSLSCLAPFRDSGTKIRVNGFSDDESLSWLSRFIFVRSPARWSLWPPSLGAAVINTHTSYCAHKPSSYIFLSPLFSSFGCPVVIKILEQQQSANFFQGYASSTASPYTAHWQTSWPILLGRSSIDGFRTWTRF